MLRIPMSDRVIPRYMSGALAGAGLLLLAHMGAGQAAAETAEERAARCASQTQIVSLAVEHRQNITAQDRAADLIRKSKDIKGSAYEPHVDVLVGWVYQLPADQLGPEASTAFEAACTAFEG